MGDIYKFNPSYDFVKFSQELEERCDDCQGNGWLHSRISMYFIDGTTDTLEGKNQCSKCKGIGKKEITHL